MSEATDHLRAATLLDYWLRETDPATTDAVEEHLMQCDACGRLLDGLAALGEGVRHAFRSGTVAAAGSGAFLQRLRGQGVQVREYQLPPGGSVQCTVAPGDELLVSRLQAPLHGVQRLDLVARLSAEPGAEHRLEDVPFDARAGEVLYFTNLAQVRQLPAHTLQLTLLAVGPGGSREVGRYTFEHTPWPGAGKH